MWNGYCIIQTYLLYVSPSAMGDIRTWKYNVTFYLQKDDLKIHVKEINHTKILQCKTNTYFCINFETPFWGAPQYLRCFSRSEVHQVMCHSVSWNKSVGPYNLIYFSRYFEFFPWQKIQSKLSESPAHQGSTVTWN